MEATPPTPVSRSLADSAPLCPELDETSELRRRVASTQVLIALRAAPHNLGAGIAATLLIVAGTGYSKSTGLISPSPISMLWAAGICTYMLFGIGLALRYSKGSPSEELIHRGGRYYLINSAVAAVAWGSTSWILLPAQAPEQEGFLLALMTMIVAAGGGGHAMYRPLMRTFTITLTTVFVLGLWRFGDLYYTIIGIAFVIYTAAIVMYARDQEVAVATSIRLSAINEALLAKSTLEREAALQAKADAEDARLHAELADRAKSTFIAAASHDLRQPLHALVQYVAHLRRTNAQPALESTVAKIEESITAMEGLLNAVLDFSKITMGAVKPIFESVDVNALFHRLDTQLQPLATLKGLAFRVEPCAGYFHSDEALLDRVLRNVAQNAVRYTNSGSVVVRARARGEMIRVMISDSGIGIASSEKQRIFEEYYQVDNAARDRRKGLGLGLAIVRDLATMLHLRIRVKSIPGAGTTFAIEVPRARVAPPASVTITDEHVVDYVRGAFVVLVDDDPLARDGVVQTLRDFGCRVLAASSGIEALHLLSQAEFAPQIVVSDYRLEGGVTGLEAIAMINENQVALVGEMFKMPAILISGDTSPVELQRVADAGYRMLHKPVSAQALHDVLNHELSSHARQ